MPAPTRPAYVPRSIEPRLRALLDEVPALLVVGPRAAGKTTTAQRYAKTVVRLDRPAEAVAFQADPDAALRGLPEPVLLDDWQAVPEVLGAVKRAVDADPRPGRFIVTGSVRADLEAATWPGTGRLLRVFLGGLSARELRGRASEPSFLARWRETGLEAAIGPADETLDLHGYLELVLTSGFPEPALRLSVPAREAWLDSYVDQLLTRDVALVDAGRDPDRLRRYLKAYATMTAQVVDESTLLEAAGVNRKTAGAYEQLLRNLFVLDALPAWSSNRVKQLVQSPKRLISDPALAASVLRLDKPSLLRAGNVLGALLETFVVAQLRADAAGLSRPPGLHHLRTRGGRHEVDVVVELGADRIVGIEVKATAAPGSGDAKHLLWLRELLGERFHGGLVLHTGPRTFKLGPGIMAAPLSVLWH